MNDIDNKIIAGTSISIIYIAFIIVSLLVVISKKHPYFVKQKLKIGALILSLSSVVSCDRGWVGCYSPIENPSEMMWINSDQIEANNVILYSKRDTSKIKGSISYRENQYFSFSLKEIIDNNNKLDSLSFIDSIEMIENIEVSDTLLYKGEILATDSLFDEYHEDFYIQIPESINAGYYYMYVYNKAANDIDEYSLSELQFCLKVID